MSGTIPQLQDAGKLAEGDLLPLHSVANGESRKASITQLATLLQTILAPLDDKRTQYASPPASGFNVQIVPPLPGAGVFLLLTPPTRHALGTVTLPPKADCLDRQEVLIFTTQAVDDLTIAGNGATVYGAPDGLAQNSSTWLRFDGVLGAWFVIAGASGESVSNGFGVQAGNGPTLEFYGLPFQQVGLVGQNTANGAVGPPIWEYSYNSINAGGDWRVVSASNWKPFYPDRPFALEFIFGRGPSGEMPDNWLVGCSTSVPSGADCVTSLADFFGFVNRVADANVRLIVRAGGANTLNLDTGIAKSVWAEGVKVRLAYDGTACTFTVFSIGTGRVETKVYGRTLLRSELSFGTAQNNGPVIGGGAPSSVPATVALVSIQGTYRL